LYIRLNLESIEVLKIHRFKPISSAKENLRFIIFHSCMADI
jgi:hypothetical protein